MKKSKLFIAFLLVAFLFTITVSAVEPRWVNTRRTFVYHEYEDGIVYCGVEVTGVFEVSHINNVDITYERYLGNNQWEEVISWENLSETGYTFYFYEELSNIPSGYTYRLRVTADVYKNGVCETIEQEYENTY